MELEEPFDKKNWVIEFKKNSRDYITEAGGVFKPLILFKKDYPTFIDETSKEMSKLDDKFNRLQKSKFKEISDIRDQVLVCK